jgi:hypothetical protein
LFFKNNLDSSELYSKHQQEIVDLKKETEESIKNFHESLTDSDSQQLITKPHFQSSLPSLNHQQSNSTLIIENLLNLSCHSHFLSSYQSTSFFELNLFFSHDFISKLKADLQAEHCFSKTFLSHQTIFLYSSLISSYPSLLEIEYCKESLKAKKVSVSIFGKLPNYLKDKIHGWLGLLCDGFIRTCQVKDFSFQSGYLTFNILLKPSFKETSLLVSNFKKIFSWLIQKDPQCNAKGFLENFFKTNPQYLQNASHGEVDFSVFYNHPYLALPLEEVFDFDECIKSFIFQEALRGFFESGIESYTSFSTKKSNEEQDHVEELLKLLATDKQTFKRHLNK